MYPYSNQASASVYPTRSLLYINCVPLAVTKTQPLRFCCAPTVTIMEIPVTPVTLLLYFTIVGNGSPEYSPQPQTPELVAHFTWAVSVNFSLKNKRLTCYLSELLKNSIVEYNPMLFKINIFTGKHELFLNNN